jgi:hypothetical protein
VMPGKLKKNNLSDEIPRTAGNLTRYRSHFAALLIKK